MAYGNFRSSGPRSGGFGGRSGGFNRGGFRRSFGPREMTKIKCSTCGKEDEVPFKPREGTPVFCKDCYFKQKGITPRAGFGEKKKEETSDEFAEEAEESEEAAAKEEEF
jgi:CxxC-x17-CxxC domain-containing protein